MGALLFDDDFLLYLSKVKFTQYNALSHTEDVFRNTIDILVQAACMLHPWWRLKAQLAIFNTDFGSSFTLLLHALLFTHFGGPPGSKQFLSVNWNQLDIMTSSGQCHPHSNPLYLDLDFMTQINWMLRAILLTGMEITSKISQLNLTELSSLSKQ